MSDDIYDTITLNSPNDRQMLKGFIDEAVIIRQKQKELSEALKDIKNEAKDKLNIKPKTFGSVVKVVYNQTMKDVQDEFSEVETVIGTIYPALIPHE